MTARLSNPTGRNTRACVVEIGAHAFYFSYATCIAYAGPLGRARVANVWGPTTGRHFRELGCGGFPVVEPEELDALVLHTVAFELPERRAAGVRS
jgi:hypothetical protein